MSAVERALQVHEALSSDFDLPLPVDPVVVARSQGINVYGADLANDLSGFIIKESAGVEPDIFLNENHSSVRQRFTCAHEIGHYFEMLENNPDTDRYYFERGVLACRGTDTQEIYANRFAAELLMPKPHLEAFLEMGYSDIEIARRFLVSNEALSNRLKSLGLRANA